MNDIIKQIEAELDRLDASDNYSETGGISVTADGDHVRLEDEAASVHGPAALILEVLKSVRGDEEATGWESAWAALSHDRHPEIIEG